MKVGRDLSKTSFAYLLIFTSSTVHIITSMCVLWHFVVSCCLLASILGSLTSFQLPSNWVSVISDRLTRCVRNCVFNIDTKSLIKSDTFLNCLSLAAAPKSIYLLYWYCWQYVLSFVRFDAIYVSKYFCPFLDRSQWWIGLCSVLFSPFVNLFGC